MNLTFSPMASAHRSISFSLFNLSKNPQQYSQNFLPFINTRYPFKIQAAGTDLLGDFGARDPFPQEIESKFGEKVLGYPSTEHKILIPIASALSLAQQDLIPLSQIQHPLSEYEAKQLLCKMIKLLMKFDSCSSAYQDRILGVVYSNGLSSCQDYDFLDSVVGWRLVHEGGSLRLQCWWKVRDINCAEVLISRINRAVESTGHVPTLRIEEPNQVRAELWTSSIGGLSMNDFIVAAKIDEIKTSDLIPRKRVWA